MIIFAPEKLKFCIVLLLLRKLGITPDINFSDF